MSTIAVVTPVNSSAVQKAVARARALATAMNLHLAGVGVLLVIALYLAVHLALVWQALGARDTAALDQQRGQLKAAEIAALPLRGLDAKLVTSNEAADKFTSGRLPYAYSEVAAELGVLTKREGVKLSRVAYTQAPGLSGKDELTEVRMDASVSGDYRPIVQFINAAERDKHFFVINGINLTGQQSGQVNLRLRMTTYLRDPNAKEMLIEMPLADEPAEGKSGGKP